MLLVPQPIYYIVGESMKLSSDFADLYYPNWYEFLGQLVFILILYTPSFAMVFMNLRMVKTCIRRVHPYYDFKKNQLYLKQKNRSGPNSPAAATSAEHKNLLNNAAKPSEDEELKTIHSDDEQK